MLEGLGAEVREGNEDLWADLQLAAPWEGRCHRD